MEKFASLRSSFPPNEAFRLFMVSEGILPATQISKPLTTVLANTAYTTFPKARILTEGAAPQVPPGAINIVYNTRFRQDTYNPMNTDEYFGIPCPRQPYPRPMKYSFYLVNNDVREATPFYTMSCPVESIQPARVLTRFAYAASILGLKVEMVGEYDAAAVRPFTADVSQQDAERIIRGMGISTVYPDYVAALRRLAHLHGAPLTDICINTEDPITLEDLEDVPRADIIQYGREIDGRRSCATVDSLRDYVIPRIYNFEPLTNPTDRSDIISNEDLQALFARVRQRNPSFQEPQPPFIYQEDVETFNGRQFVPIVAVLTRQNGSTIDRRVGIVPLNVTAGPGYTSDVLLDLLTNPDNVSKILRVTPYRNTFFINLTVPIPSEASGWMTGGNIDTGALQRYIQYARRLIAS